MPDPDILTILDPQQVVHPQTGRLLPFEPSGDGRRLPTPVTDDVATLLRALIDLLRPISLDVQALRRGRADNLASWQVVAVTVTTAGTPVQGPSLPVPPGFELVVIQRRHTGSHTGYVAPSQPEVRDTTSRKELWDTGSIRLRVDNMNELWFNAGSVPTGGLTFELLVEHERR